MNAMNTGCVTFHFRKVKSTVASLLARRRSICEHQDPTLTHTVASGRGRCRRITTDVQLKTVAFAFEPWR